MNLNDQTVNNTNQVNVLDSLNSALMKLVIKRNATTVAPNSDDLLVYVDKQNSSNPTSERKTYLFELIKPLDYFNGVSDEFIMQLDVKNNKSKMDIFVKRLIAEDEFGVKSILSEPIYEELDYSQIILFSGVNYIYTNYTDADITLIYPKDNDINKIYLNNSIYVNDLENHMEHTLEDIYFSNCFTKTENKINIEVNNANIDCITSRNNNFSLDDEGNLIVRTITVADPISSTDLLSIYPIGSIYMSINNVNPSTLFGGVWEQIKDTFLLACGDTYNNGAIGGEAEHLLTANETGLPAHNHSHNHRFANNRICPGIASGNSWSANKVSSGSTTSRYYISRTDDSSTYQVYQTDTDSTNNTSRSASEAHNNMPPYLAVYMWKRTQ